MRRLSALVASLLLLAEVSLPGGVQDDGSLRLKLLLRLVEDPARASWRPPPRPGPEVAALLMGSWPRSAPAWELLRRRPKRPDPPLSIDLTFHLLRQMLEISRAQSQQAQAEKNRLLLASVGK